MKINRSCKITIQKNDWFEEDERWTSYFFNLEKRNGQNKLWQKIKGSDGNLNTI